MMMMRRRLERRVGAGHPGGDHGEGGGDYNPSGAGKTEAARGKAKRRTRKLKITHGAVLSGMKS